MLPRNVPHVPLMQSPPGPYAIIDGRRYLYFAGTGYLGLQDNPEIIDALCAGARKYGINSASSRAALGNTPPVVEVERLAAGFFDREDSFYFPTGYAGTLVLASALAATRAPGDILPCPGAPADAVFIDERAYFCLREAAPLLQRPVHSFRHADPQDLRNNLRTRLKPCERPLVMSDGVFGATGDIAPVADYVAVLADYPGATLLLDDAHGVGVLGDSGRGTFEHAGLYDRVNTDSTVNGPDRGPRLMISATLSKAIGGYGGIIPGSRGFVQHVKNASHWFDCSSAPPVPIAAATVRALELVIANPDYRTRLRENVRFVRDGLRQMGLEAGDSPVPIISLAIGAAENMRRIQSGLQAQGIIVAYRGKRSGVVSEGAIRLAVFATHSKAMIEQLLDTLRTLL